MLLARLMLAAFVSLVPMMLEGSYGLPMTGGEAEAFLRDARIVRMKPIGVGITKPMKVTLTDGERTHHAVWKSINPNRKIFEARKRETAALGAGEKLVLGHPLAATIGDSARFCTVYAEPGKRCYSRGQRPQTR